MTRFILIFALLLLFAGSSLAAANKYSQEEQEKNTEKWTACSDSSECVVVQGACESECVNQQFASEAEAYYHVLGTMVSCVASQHTSLPQCVCQENKCVAEYPDEQDKQSLKQENERE